MLLMFMLPHLLATDFNYGIRMYNQQGGLMNYLMKTH